MRRHASNSRSEREQGIIITLVAVFILFVVGAMAALSIDVVTFYTARSEAQIAADGAALAGARVLANSGMTSSTDSILAGNAESLASAVAKLVAQQNPVGGRKLDPTKGEVTVTTSDACSTPTAQPYANPCVTVRVQRSDLPTFFARTWGTKTISVGATATAEAYNPSGLATVSTGSSVAPVAPSCVKPWLLPNIDPTNGNTIFKPDTGAITDSGLLGCDPSTAFCPGIVGSTRLHARCNAGCTSPTDTPSAWQYYQEDESNFPASQALPACAAGLSTRQQSIAGCVPTPVTCGSVVTILTIPDPTLDQDAADAVDCLTNTTYNPTGGDKISSVLVPPAPFHFDAGDANPLVMMSGVLTASANIMVSNSLVTVPVFDSSTFSPTPPNSAQVQIIGFVQLFLQPSGNKVPSSYTIRTKIINMVGCGTNALGVPPVYGNGPSAVPVRLITPPSP